MVRCVNTFEHSPACDRVRLLLQKGPADKKTVMTKAFLSNAHAHDTLKFLHTVAKEIHVQSWQRNKVGKPTPTYAWGRKEDAPKPVPIPKRQLEKAYRERMKAKLGENYKHFIYALNDPKPGRQIVVEGKVVWEQR